MDNLLIAATPTTPKVLLDSTSNIFEITGESRPENTSKFYTPIFDWFNKYESVLFFQKNHFKKSQKLILKLQFDYFNSTSAKFILDIFYLVEKMNKEGYEAEIHWYYDKQDIDMKESGEEFAKLVPYMSIKYFEF
ncbi:MAG: hypothetical protein A3F72_21550 [Bacteroidetes bacterium RIFCSPLOWO2_12_FULL_35_15]|nr:MAG: hypothetical protein A3F72_21550 [Bacteroidetes bacterium RIFCSPLOWO2_12_FULL_35_15]